MTAPDGSAGRLYIDERGRLARWAAWESRTRSLGVDAIAIGDGTPVIFVSGEVLVGASEQEVIADCLAQGGEIVPQGPLMPAPPEILQTRQLNDAPFPMPVRIRFKEPPRNEQPEKVLPEALSRVSGGQQESSGVQANSSFAAALASLVARHSWKGGDVALNMLGHPAALHLANPVEGAGADPSTWPAFKSPTRIVEAWQLIESVRAVRYRSPVVWIAILDTGFWVDAAGAPLVDPSEAASDFGLGIPQINLVNPGTPVGGPYLGLCGGSPCQWHGNSVASVATAPAGNNRGAAGSGAPVARPFLFERWFRSWTMRRNH